jgi:hypothetical protein
VVELRKTIATACVKVLIAVLLFSLFSISVNALNFTYPQLVNYRFETISTPCWKYWKNVTGFFQPACDGASYEGNYALRLQGASMDSPQLGIICQQVKIPTNADHLYFVEKGWVSAGCSGVTVRSATFLSGDCAAYGGNYYSIPSDAGSYTWTSWDCGTGFSWASETMPIPPSDKGQWRYLTLVIAGNPGIAYPGSHFASFDYFKFYDAYGNVIPDAQTDEPIALGACYDSDGIDSHTKGYCTDPSGTYTDYCAPEGINGVLEAFCYSSAECALQGIFCNSTEHCEDGACVPGIPTPPPGTPVTVSKTCEKTSLTRIGNVSCFPDAISIPAGATGVTSYTSVNIIPYNADYAGNPSKTFYESSCNPSGVCTNYEKTCQFPDYIIPVTKTNNNYLGGQTVTSYGLANVPDGCLVAPNPDLIYFKLSVTTSVSYTLGVPPGKTASLTVSPTTGTSSTAWTWYVVTSNLTKPYNISFYSDNLKIGWETNVNYDSFTTATIGEAPGSHRYWFNVTDAVGTNLNSNDVWITVTGLGIQPCNITASPTSGNATDIFTFTTSRLYGGAAPYLAHIYLIPSPYAGYEIGTPLTNNCNQIAENDVCRATAIIPPGNYTVWARITDSLTSSIACSGNTFNVSGASLGQPLTASLSMIPSTGDTNTVFTFTLDITGGVAPYRVTWLDLANEVCVGEIYSQQAPLSVSERFLFWAGSHGVQASIHSSDGQIAPTNRLDFSVTYLADQNITALDCKGTLGNWTPRIQRTLPAGVPGVVGVPSGYADPVISKAELDEMGVGWLAPFFTPFFLSTVALIGVSGFVALKVKTNAGVVFGIVALLLTLVFTIIGIYPLWLGIIFMLIGGFIVVRTVSGVLGGE